MISPVLAGSRPEVSIVYDGAPAIRSMRNAIARMATAETAMIALERVGRARKVSTKGGMD